MKIYYWKILIFFFALSTIYIWFAVLASFDKNYQVVVCDVGQGDSILVQHKNTQMLIDGGSGSAVLDCLADQMPFWDKEIELIVLTHPQQDHFGGLTKVLRNYGVKKILATEIENEAISYQEFKKIVIDKNIQVINPRENMKILFSEAVLYIVHPDLSMFEENKNNDLGSVITDQDPNDYSVSFMLTIDSVKMFFTGDIGPKIIEDLINDGQLSDIDILKVPHHGSKNGLTESLLLHTTPEVALISAGRANRFGHPHKEVINLLEKYKVKILRTDEHGDIIISTDGKNYKLIDQM